MGFPRDAARLRGVVRVLREWVLARSAPASPLARACALHLLCRDAGFLHDGCLCLRPLLLFSALCAHAICKLSRAELFVLAALLLQCIASEWPFSVVAGNDKCDTSACLDVSRVPNGWTGFYENRQYTSLIYSPKSMARM